MSLSRRQLGKAGAMLGIGGMGAQRRPDQQYDPPGTPVSPSTAGGVLRARLVIVSGPGGGVFVYSPAPGTGNLIASIAGQSGTDAFGNAYPAGITSFGTSGFDTTLEAAVLSFTDGASTISDGYVQATGGGVLALASPVHAGQSAAEIGLFSGATPVIYEAATVIPDPAIVAQQPGQPGGTPEVWHNVTPPTGWSGVCRVKLLAEGSFACFDFHLTGSGAGTTFGTFPSSVYYPNTNKVWALGFTGTNAGTNARLDINTSGTPTIGGLPATIPFEIDMTAIYPLD
jgi:hypothetical protein